MMSNGDNKFLSSNDNNMSMIDNGSSNLLLFFQYLSNQNNSPYENGGIKNKIPLEKIFLELGPFLLTTNIDFLNISFVDYNFNKNRFIEFLLFIINNPEINYSNNNIKRLNRLFLESINSGIGIRDKINYLQGSIPWNIDILSGLFHERIESIDKINLLISFDNPLLNINDKKKFDFFTEILTKFNFFGNNYENIQLFFDEFLFTKWKNVKNQIILLDLMITNKEISETSKYSLNNYTGKKISKDIELKAYTSTKNLYLIDNWRNVKLVETLINISKDYDNYTQIKMIFNWAIKNIPEIIIMSLLIINIDLTKNSLLNDLVIEILSSILFDKNPQIKLINEIWQINKSMVIYVLNNSYENLPNLMNLSVILDLSNNIIKDSMLPLVNSKYHDFSVHLGLLASKRDYLHIEKWLKKNIEIYGDEFVNSLLNYLNINVVQPCQINFSSGNYLNEINKGNILEKAQLTLESLDIILKTLNSYTNNDNNKLSLKTKKEITEISKVILNLYDEILDQQINSSEIREEISRLLGSMFEGKITTDHIINLLIVYKSSNDKRKIELYSCLIHHMIDEYRYLGQYNYKKDKIKLFAELFGKIINNKLLEGVLETLALNYIAKSIKNGSEQFYLFGITALYQIIGNISWWPKYINVLLDIEQIKQNKNLYMIILRENEKVQKRYRYEKSGIYEKQNGLVPSNKSDNKSTDLKLEDHGKHYKNNNTNNIINSQIDNKDKENKERDNYNKLKYKLSGSAKSFILDDNSNNININNVNNKNINSINNNNNNNNIIINEAEKDISLIEKIAYNTKKILENNNQKNIIEKASEIKIFLNNDETCIKIFSYTLIITKISQNKNIIYFQDLLTIINNSTLYKYVSKYTIKYIQALLKINSLHIEEKNFNTLKNLGLWLGFITIYKDKPILARDIDFRELITESFKNDKLIITIPFICNVFSCINKSKIFNMNNPWINSILCLLKEVFFLRSLNQNIKKEIQNFFEIVKIDMSALTIKIEYLSKVERLENEDRKLDFPNEQKYYLIIDKKQLEKKVGTLNNFIDNLLYILNNEKNIFSYNFVPQNMDDIFDSPTMNKINQIIFSNNDTTKNDIETKKEMIIFLSNLLHQSIIDTIPKMRNIYFNNPILAAISIVNQDFIYELDIEKYRTAINNIIKGVLSSFSILSFHDMLKRNIGINLDNFVKSHEVSTDTIILIKDLPNKEYINIGLEEILLLITKEAQNILNSNNEFKAELDRRKTINAMKIKRIESKSNQKLISIINSLPEGMRPNKKGLSQKEFKIYENFHMNNQVLKLYQKDGKISEFYNLIFHILKEVIDKIWEGNTSSIKVSKYKNYEQCMKNIINICNNKEFNYRNKSSDDEQPSLNILTKIIIDSKIDKIDIINKMAMKTLDFVILSKKMNNTLLLRIYIFILKGWTKLNNDVVNQITKRIFKYDFDVDIFTLFKYDLHQNLLKQKLVNIELYEDYMINLIKQSYVKNRTIHNLIKSILSDQNYYCYVYKKYVFNKLKGIIQHNIINDDFYLLFNKKTSILISTAKNYNSEYKNDSDIKNQSLVQNDNQDNKDKKELNSLYVYYFVNITRLCNYDIFQNEKNISEDDKMQNMFSENDILNCIKQISEICMSNTFDSKFQKYSYFFYPEKLSIFVFYLVKNKNISFPKILDIIIQCFHSDYVNNTINFNQNKYYKFFLNLIGLVASPTFSDNNEEFIINNLILICDTLKILSPKNYPGFTLAWLDLISYHSFINNFLETKLIKENSYKYEKYLSLLIELLSYLNQIKTQIIKHYNYKYILDEIFKFFFLLCNTYPYFITAYYYLLISCLSLSVNQSEEEANLFIQLKNLILSTIIINKNVFKENYLTKTVLKDNSIPNKIIYLITGSYIDEKLSEEDLQLKTLLDEYIEENNDDNILDDILEIFDKIKDELELNYVYNGLSLYMFYYEMNYYQKNGDNNKLTKKIFYNFYLYLLCNLNEIHKKHLIDSILNAQLFLNSTIIDFSSLFQELLLNIENEDIEKQLITNLLERFLYEPIPLGIRNTFKCLSENDKFKHMEKIYLKGNEEIENFLEEIHKQIKLP